MTLLAGIFSDKLTARRWRPLVRALGWVLLSGFSFPDSPPQVTAPALPGAPTAQLTANSRRPLSFSAMAVHLSKEEEKEFREIFNLVDRDKGGSISKAELAQLMDTLAINASQQEIGQQRALISTRVTQGSRFALDRSGCLQLT